MIVVGHAATVYTPWGHDIPNYQGVTFFFVLSGFILTYSHPNLTGLEDIKLFWVSRVARIWPAVLASIALAFALIPSLSSEYASPEGMLRAALAIFCVQSWVPIWDYYFALNAVLWSISVEAFFYACFPVLVRDIRSTWPWKLALCALFVSVMVATTRALHLPNYAITGRAVDGSALIYSFPLTRLFDFMLGIVAAMAYSRSFAKRPMSPNFATVAELAILTILAFQFQFGATWYEVTGPLAKTFSPALCLWFERSGSAFFYAALVVVFAQERGVISNLLRSRWLVLGGEISFSVYLTHQVLLRAMQAHPQTVEAAPAILLWAGYCAAVLGVSYFFWAFIEKPCRRLILDWYKMPTPAPTYAPACLPRDDGCDPLGLRDGALFTDGASLRQLNGRGHGGDGGRDSADAGARAACADASGYEAR